MEEKNAKEEKPAKIVIHTKVKEVVRKPSFVEFLSRLSPEVMLDKTIIVARHLLPLSPSHIGVVCPSHNVCTV